MTNFFGILAYCITMAGLLGFFGSAWISWFPSKLLDRFELPNDPIEGVRLTAPDGRIFIVSRALDRVQRYGPAGFEIGFRFGRKASKYGMSSSGNILLCTHSGELFTYSPDGAELPSGAFCGSQFDVHPLYASHAQVPRIAFNWFSSLAVPLWHPFAGWLTGVLGLLLLKLASRTPDAR
ncbi:hypothetical protein JQ625_19370 [Bradyrhizobium diazoefficiens]|nr:hypothetical protein [Bradyrhizobium diazoefficiens]MBR0777002.1 hypothetical protein [Bradyrhizobium diazoefficiens]